MVQTQYQLRRRIVEAGKRLFALGLISGADGNVSVRFEPERLLVTPTGVPKADLVPSDIVVTDLSGRVYGRGRPSSELNMHLDVYRRRPDVQAAIHAHPPWTIAASLHEDIRFDFVPEAVVALGGVFRLPYARPGTPAVAESVRPHVLEGNTFILTRHGSLSLGATLDQALIRLENLEHNARIALLARAAGPFAGLPEAEIAALRGGGAYGGGAGASTPAQIPPTRGMSRVRISDEEPLVPGRRS